MMAASEILVIIPARGGSKRVPLKNIVPIAGRPALAYAVDSLREATIPLRCVLLTDHPQIASIGRGLGLQVLDEPAELAVDAGVDETHIMDFVLSQTEISGCPFRHVLFHYACVPVRPLGIVDNLVAFLDETGADFVQTVAAVSPHQHAYRLVSRALDGQMTDYVPGSSQFSGQEYPQLFFRTAAGVGFRRDSLAKFKGNVNWDRSSEIDRRCLIHAPDDCVDIDEPRDIMCVWRQLDFPRTTIKLPGMAFGSGC